MRPIILTFFLFLIQCSCSNSYFKNSSTDTEVIPNSLMGSSWLYSRTTCSSGTDPEADSAAISDMEFLSEGNQIQINYTKNITRGTPDCGGLVVHKYKLSKSGDISYLSLNYKRAKVLSVTCPDLIPNPKFVEQVWNDPPKKFIYELDGESFRMKNPNVKKICPSGDTLILHFTKK